MHHERCLREPITIHRRRRNCTDRQCPFRASLCELDSQVFLVTRPMTAVVGGRLGVTPLPPRGKSIAPNRGLPRPEHRYNSKTRKPAQWRILANRTPTWYLLPLRSDDLERLLRGAWSGGFNLGTGLVAFGNVPRLSAYPPDHTPRSHHICHTMAPTKMWQGRHALASRPRRPCHIVSGMAHRDDAPPCEMTRAGG